MHGVARTSMMALHWNVSIRCCIQIGVAVWSAGIKSILQEPSQLGAAELRGCTRIPDSAAPFVVASQEALLSPQSLLACAFALVDLLQGPSELQTPGSPASTGLGTSYDNGLSCSMAAKCRAVLEPSAVQTSATAPAKARATATATSTAAAAAI